MIKSYKLRVLQTRQNPKFLCHILQRAGIDPTPYVVAGRKATDYANLFFYND
jgi:hypothetical protein